MTLSDEELQTQIETISELPLEHRAEALSSASEALRELLDSADS